MTQSPRKLRNPLQGVLAGGIDPATSPMYSLSPVLVSASAAGAAQMVFGVSAWPALLMLATTVFVYGMVMHWERAGRGAQGLSEEEFGGWAIKFNAAVELIMLVSAALVSMAAAASFLSDWLPFLRSDLVADITGGEIAAAALAVGLGALVLRRPRLAQRAYRPAALGALLLLWVLVAGALVTVGLQLPTFDPGALTTSALAGAALISFASLLGLLTGLNVFASMELAYEGMEVQRSRKAFASMAVVAVSLAAFLLLAAPAMVSVVDPTDSTSLFSQGIAGLLPGPLAALAAVAAFLALLVMAVVALLGLQGLAVGLRDRRLAPAFWGQRNRQDVAEWPVRLAVAVAVVCFLLFGAAPAIYLPIYVAGTLALLSVTSIAAVGRALRRVREAGSPLVLPIAAALAAFLVLAATLTIFWIWLKAGVWIYFLAAPVLYLVFHFTRRRMGAPNPLQEELGRREQALTALGLPIDSRSSSAGANERFLPVDTGLPAANGGDLGLPAAIRQVAVALDGSPFAERALPTAAAIARIFDASLVLLTVLPERGALRVLPKGRSSGNPVEVGQVETEIYLNGLAGGLRTSGIRASYYVAAGPVASAIDIMVRELDADLLVMSTHGRSGISRFMLGSNANAALQLSSRPLLLLRPDVLPEDAATQVNRVLLPLDGSPFAELMLPWAQAVAVAADPEFILLSVPEVPDPSTYGAMPEMVESLRAEAEADAWRYLEEMAARFTRAGLRTRTLVAGSRPATAILDVAEQEQVDLIMLATHGRGGLDRLVVGSVADRVLHHSPCPTFLLPVREDRSDVR